MTTAMQNAGRARPSWRSRFWAVVRYEMLWNIRKKKFIGMVIVVFALVTVQLALPVAFHAEKNPDYIITSFNVGSFGFILFALVTAMNSISSEFETGTIVPLLTKPVSRTMVFLGKLFAAFVIILVTYTILFVYGILGASIVYGLQNNLQLVPLVLLGNVLSTFIWVAIILAVGSISKSTMIAALAGLGLFLGLLIGVQVVSLLAGPSPALSYVPGSGDSGMLNFTGGSTSVATGTDNIGLNLVNYVLHPSANVTFLKTNIQIQAGGSPQMSQSFAYMEPMSVVALRSVGVAFAYILVFLLTAWYTFKRTQILE